jgi:hypothetical protein
MFLFRNCVRWFYINLLQYCNGTFLTLIEENVSMTLSNEIILTTYFSYFVKNITWAVLNVAPLLELRPRPVPSCLPCTEHGPAQAYRFRSPDELTHDPRVPWDGPSSSDRTVPIPRRKPIGTRWRFRGPPGTTCPDGIWCPRNRIVRKRHNNNALGFRCRAHSDRF